MKLIAVRHAEVIDTGICYGRLELKTRAKRSVREQLHREIGVLVAHHPCTLWSSPSERCLREATLAGVALNATPQVDLRLTEIAFGEWEGQKWSDLETLAEFKEWMTNWQEAIPPGGESLSDLTKRVTDWRTHLASDSIHVVFTHAGVIRQLHVSLGELDWPSAMSLPVPHLTPIIWNGSTST